LNVFDRPIGESQTTPIRISDKFLRVITNLDSEKHVCLIHGFWSVFGAFLIFKNQTSFNQRQIKYYSNEFCATYGYESGLRITARTGAAFKVLQAAANENSDIISKLKIEFGTEQASKLSAIVPQLHNEAYQNLPIGRSQCIFMAVNNPQAIQNAREYPNEFYWQYIGREIANRLTR
jgi:hypothetical protein